MFSKSNTFKLCHEWDRGTGSLSHFVIQYTILNKCAVNYEDVYGDARVQMNAKMAAGPAFMMPRGHGTRGQVSCPLVPLFTYGFASY